MTTAATTALSRIADALEEMIPLLERLATPLIEVSTQEVLDTEPEEECADVAEARRSKPRPHRHTSGYCYGGDCA